MNRLRERRARLVVSPSPWSVNTVLLVAVFVVTSGVVYHWGSVSRRRAHPAPGYTAAATVRHAELPRENTEGSHTLPRRELLARAERRISCRSSLQTAVSALPRHAMGEIVGDDDAAAVSQVVDRLQEGLQVSLDESGAGQMEVRVAYTDNERDRASELVRAVARQYVETLRLAWNRATEETHARAATATEEARRQWQLAEAERQEFVDRFLADQEREFQQVTPVQERKGTGTASDRGQTDQSHTALGSAPPCLSTRGTLAAPAPAENLEWSRLTERRTQLERRRAELLLDRTHAHPAVQLVENELAEVHRALSGPGRWNEPPTGLTLRVSPPADKPSTPTTEAESDPAQAAEKHAAARREIDRLGREAALARSRYEQLTAVERAAWADRLRGPEVEVAFTPPVALTTPNSTREHLLSTSLLAGIAMMVGVGMFAAGAAIEPVLVSAEQVSALLGVPAIATVTLPGLKPAGSRQHRRWLRLASCLGGVILMAGCLAMLCRAIAG